MSIGPWQTAAELDYTDHPDDPANDPQWTTPVSATEWAELAGQYQDDREKLLQGIHAVENGFLDGTADIAWRALLRRARFIEGTL